MYQVRYCTLYSGWQVLLETDDYNEARERFYESLRLDDALDIKGSWTQVFDTVNKTVILEDLGNE